MLSMVVSSLVARIDAGDPPVIVAGTHVGCFELFGTRRIRSVRDLRGKVVAVSELGNADRRHAPGGHEASDPRARESADLCAADPERTVRFLVESGYPSPYDYAVQSIREVPYRRWREYDPADAVRFYALRMHEAGLVKSTPQRLLAQGTDWRSGTS